MNDGDNHSISGIIHDNQQVISRSSNSANLMSPGIFLRNISGQVRRNEVDVINRHQLNIELLGQCRLQSSFGNELQSEKSFTQADAVGFMIVESLEELNFGDELLLEK